MTEPTEPTEPKTDPAPPAAPAPYVAPLRDRYLGLAPLLDERTRFPAPKTGR